MKRSRYVKAEVWRSPIAEGWMVQVYEPSRNRPHEADAKRSRIVARSKPVGATTDYFTAHAEALRFALAEVGLTEKNTEKETNR